MRIWGKEVPEAWLSLLATVQTVFPDAVLAGGCLRDLALGEEPKDIDIFVSTPDNHAPDCLMALAAQEGWGSMGGGSSTQYDGTENELEGFCEFYVEGLPPVQVIFLNKPRITITDVISRMDFGICQVGTDGNQVIMTLNCRVGIRDRVFRLIRVDSERKLVESRKRAERFKARFGGRITIDMSADPMNDMTVAPAEESPA